MTITFPQLGNTCYAAKAVFDNLGIDYIMPPKSNKKCLELGSLYSPEDICLPFKIMLGAYIDCIKRGADTIIITGSCGPCRFGEYCEMQINLLNNLGYNVDFIVLDKPSSIGKSEFFNRISKISNASSISNFEKMKTLYSAYKIINLIDYIEKTARYKAGFELKKGECKRILNSCKNSALNTTGADSILALLLKYKRMIKNVPIDPNKQPLKISIIGEIYTILEPFSNFYIEDKLMDLGISTQKTLNPSWWFKDAILSAINLNSLSLRINSKKYLPYYIGGHGRECIGEAVTASKAGFDGAIQLFPMGCMPEIVSKAILPSISKEKDFPILSLIIDEMTGDAGYMTRIEAFIDLLERRKNKCII
ncbi:MULTISPECIES: acyl-CoA dehydratase activase-related protein [Clostridium]|uniref:acyl-CoA dehydratase activase-related protein n=1 Tax=Clostridium TaxID=1485 RepID=UPI000824D82F|nr:MULTISPECIES: acyl-CoA dehydratase activase-related protein [Clostridium]PJI09624.1 2-hydroxyglutaryl-CoA dehydratase [Clostridium sp. CT7]